MLRYLSAIGMSKYTGSKDIQGWVSEFLHRHEDRPIPFQWPGSERMHLEFVHHMGPFRLVVKACPEDDGVMRVYALLPSVRFHSRANLLHWEMGLEDTNLVVFGEDEDSGGPVFVRLERTGLMLDLPVPQSGESVRMDYTALSIEGKVILGILRTEEDEQMYAEEEQWRQEMLEKYRSGDEEAIREIEMEMQEQDLEVAERMKHEDMFSVIEGFFMPIDDITSGTYHVMGTILDAEKVFNPETEEWVWHLELDVIGQGLDIYIHPNDLVGVPMKGCRFFGKVILIGSMRL